MGVVLQNNWRAFGWGRQPSAVLQGFNKLVASDGEETFKGFTHMTDTGTRGGLVLFCELKLICGVILCLQDCTFCQEGKWASVNFYYNLIKKARLFPSRNVPYAHFSHLSFHLSRSYHLPMAALFLSFLGTFAFMGVSWGHGKTPMWGREW